MIDFFRSAHAHVHFADKHARAQVPLIGQILDFSFFFFRLLTLQLMILKTFVWPCANLALLECSNCAEICTRSIFFAITLPFFKIAS